MTEEERQNLQIGTEKVVRITANPDLDGYLQIVRREIADTKKTSPDVRETKTTVFLSDGAGGLALSMQTPGARETQQRSHS